MIKFSSIPPPFKGFKEDMNEIVRELEQPTKLLLREKKVELKLSLAIDLPKVWLDRDKIIEVLTNILDNAVKFTDAGSILIQTEMKADQKVRVVVRDTGIGIKSENIPKLFSSFTQVHETPNRVGGSGLGLAIARKIIEQHQGQISVESDFGVGTTFSFELPIKQSEQADLQKVN